MCDLCGCVSKREGERSRAHTHKTHLEGPAARLDWDHLGAQRAHPEDVELLALRVDLTHVHNALEPHHGAHSGGGNSMLPRTSLGDDARFAEPLGEDSLANGVVDLVGAGVREVLALEPDACSTAQLGEALREIDRGGTADELVTEVVDLGLKGRGCCVSIGVTG